MKQDITCVFEAVSGVGGIYISNVRAAQNLILLQTLQIKAIVSVVRNGIVSHSQSEISHYLYVPADDIETYDISQHFQQTYNFIDKTRKQTNVLVHCHAGISRSATIVIAYLMKKYNYSLDKIISMIRRRRNIINPNRGFIQQLKKEATKIGISQKQGQKDQVLIRSALNSYKHRSSLFSYSAQKLLKQKISPQTKRMVSLHKKPLKNQQQPTLINISFNHSVDFQVKNQEKSPKIYMKISKEQNEFDIKISKIQENRDLNQHAILASALYEKKYIKVPIQTKPLSMTFSKAFSQQQNNLLPQKLDRIQKLRSKILQSESRKKSKGKMSLSQTNSFVGYNQIFGEGKIESSKIKTLESTREGDRKQSSDDKSTTDSIIIKVNIHQNTENQPKDPERSEPRASACRQKN